MPLFLTLIGFTLSSVLFAWGVPIARLFEAFQSLTSVLTIIIAAVFVRLNRGFPTLDWKTLEAYDRERLTTKIVAISKEYAWIVAINSVTIGTVFTLTVLGREQIQSAWPKWLQMTFAGGLAGSVFLCISRMGYVIWRDVDVMHLQKALIDRSASKDSVELETKSADAKLQSIKSAGLTRLPVPPPTSLAD